MRAIESKAAPGAAETVRKGFEENRPLHRHAENEKFAALMAFLTRDEASYCTGAPFVIDGGYTAPMRSLQLVGLAVVLLLVGVQCERSAPDDVWIEGAKGVADEFQAALKGKLIAAMKEGGPVRAIQICSAEAPKVGQQIAAGKAAQWTVSRTAVRVRNPKNRPTDWQKEVLGEFQRRIAAGEPLDQVTWRGRRGDEFVFMRPIMMDGACMTCHGPTASIPQAVQTELGRLYPRDEATGFSPGDMRGAFVVAGPATPSANAF